MGNNNNTNIYFLKAGYRSLKKWIKAWVRKESMKKLLSDCNFFDTGLCSVFNNSFHSGDG